jgi:rhodanese-related sulfurtransferase
VYCNDGSVTGPSATALLNKSGFPLAVNLQSGIEGWRAAGFQTKSG